MKHEESKIQEAVVSYLRHQYPNALHCASAGGVRTSMKQAIMMKRTGYVRGFPDLMILESSKEYKGLFIEMKTEKGVASKEQKWMGRIILALFSAIGYSTGAYISAFLIS